MKKGNILILIVLIAFSSCQKEHKNMAEYIELLADGNPQTFVNSGYATLCNVEFQDRTMIAYPNLYMVTGQAGANNLLRLPLRDIGIGGYEIIKNDYDVSMFAVNGILYQISAADTITVTITQSDPLEGTFEGTVSKIGTGEQISITNGIFNKVPIIF